MRQIITIMMCIFSLQISAGESIDKSLDVKSDGSVKIHNVRGDIKLIGWDKAQVSVKGKLDDLAEKFIFKTEGDVTIIKVQLPRNTSHRSRGGSDLIIRVPSESVVTFSGVATDLHVQDVLGGLDINSVSGDIEISNAKKKTYINNVSGKIVLKDIDGRLDVSTVSGDLDARVNCNKISVSGVSADIKVFTDTFDSANISTVSGDASLFGKMAREGDLKLGTVSGDAIYYVVGTLDAMIKMETAPGGDIVNEYSDDKPKSSFINSHNLKFKTGDGNGVVKMSTVSGTIGFKKK